MSKELVRSDGPDPGKGQFLVYEAEDGQVKIDVRLEDETVWLTQKLMADLFQTTKQNIALHIQSVFDEGELAPKATAKKYLTVRRGPGHTSHPYAHGRLDQKTGCLSDAQ